MDFFPFQCGSWPTPHAERGATPLHHPVPATAVPTPHLGHPHPVLEGRMCLPWATQGSFLPIAPSAWFCTANPLVPQLWWSP